MLIMRNVFLLAAMMTLATVIGVGCSRTFTGSTKPATPAASAQQTTLAATKAPASSTPAANPFASVPGILDRSNFGWPREVQGMNGKVTVKAKPQRIHTLSLGHDEVTYALVPAQRVVAVGRYTQDPVYSNVAELAKKVPGLGREPEQVVAQQPDIVIASHTIKTELIAALQNVGLTVVQTELHNDTEGRIQDILFLGYLYGEEQRAIELAKEVRSRSDALAKIVSAKPAEKRPRVLPLTMYSDKIYTAGKGATEGAIVEAAGGLNPAAEAGIQGNKTISSEGIISMRPDVIVIAQPADSGGAFRQKLMSDPALADVPAIKSKRVHLVEAKFFTTLSFWNLRGAEDLATLLWPDDFRGKEFPPFSMPK
ncbi:MAG: ABC transporter substrate-binding protein [Chloroflexi bacterium]|nr:ABC transporter substrate-binding protein [Chloroflexota bacterium]